MGWFERSAELYFLVGTHGNAGYKPGVDISI